ncbi:MAG: hypothetical protein LBP59_00020 [Planctomycetaceae bacterium]|jgi:hypothetical protein|nr:hypothetical protein [Planctomycetaceae bacterium]
MGRIYKSGDRISTSIVVNTSLHRRVRELTGFNFGGFSHFLEISLSAILPFVESYYMKHEKEFKSCDNVLFSIANDKTDFDYEMIGRKVVAAIQEKTKEVYNGK